jgi:hypothetical protein
MTSNPLPLHRGDPPSLPRTGAGVVVASIAAAAIVGLLTLVQIAPLGAQTIVPASADSAPQRDAVAPLDRGVDWQRVDHAPEQNGASVAAYER